MATAPSALQTERSPAALRRDDVIWWSALAVLGSLSVAWVLLPSDLLALREVVIYPSVELGAVLCILIGVRRYRPSVPRAWLAIAAGIFLWFVGDLIWGINEVVGREPFPSVGDFFYIAGYPLIALGLALAVRLRSGKFRAETGTLIDVLLVAVLALLLAWVYLIDPILDDDTLTGTQKAVSIAYPLADVLLVSIAARFVMGTSWHVPALWLLVSALGLTLVGDVVYSTDLAGGQHGERVGGAALLAGLVCFGLAGLTRSMRALTEERREQDMAPDKVRHAFLAIACLIPPGVLIFQSLHDEPLYLGATVLAMGCATGLVVYRFMNVTNRIRRAVAREALLRGYAAELLGTHDEDELGAAAIRTASQLVGGGTVALVPPGGEPEDVQHGFTVPVEVRGERLAELVVDGDPVHVRRARDALTTVAAQLALAIERERLLEAEREAAEALAEQNERLIEIDRMKDRFVSSVSHELRTPLTSMVGYLELLVDADEEELDEEERAHFLEIVNRNCLRLNRIVDDILFVARVDAGRLSLEREPVDFAELAAASVESARANAAAKGIDLRLAADGRLPQLEADPLRLTQMLDNLVSNAIKFTPEDGTVTVGVSSGGDDGVHLEVSDTGVGIPADEVDKLFDRFFRASTSAVAQGTGLGLSIVKSIVDVHGGTISVESVEAVGTTFTVDLPTHMPPETPTAAEPLPTEVPT